jgi:hypothetical protein
MLWSNWRVEDVKCGVTPEVEGKSRRLTGETASIRYKISHIRKIIVDRFLAAACQALSNA